MWTIVLVTAYWSILSLLLYTWVLYVLVLKIVSITTKRKTNKFSFSYQPIISIIIAAHNEEENIKNRIKNCLTLDYPKDKVEIIVASDGSIDKTNEIVRQISQKNKQVVLLPFKKQKGRAFIHNESVNKAKGDIVIFTDAEAEFAKDFLQFIIPPFSDPMVGCVSGRIYYKNVKESSIGESAGIYWQYEELIRKLESDIGILSFGTGAALAVRKIVYKPIGLDEDIDRVTTLNAKLDSYKVKYEPRAKVYDYIESDERKAHSARVRKTSRAFRDVLKQLRKINPLNNPFLFCSIFFHKISRHLTPFYMMGIFMFNILLFRNGKIYVIFFLCQSLFYIFALIGWGLEKINKKIVLFYIPYNFILLNAGRFVGVLKSIRGLRVTTYN